MRHAPQDEEEWRGNMEPGELGGDTLPPGGGWEGQRCGKHRGIYGLWRHLQGILLEVVSGERIRVMITGNREAAD